MAGGSYGSVLQQVRRLFERGTVAGLGEAALLERFVARRDEAAFEALVARFGPMVLALCRRMLDDPNDVDDAFQATFLVLVRRAPAIRDGERLGNWLYGVAYRVAARARAQAARRRRRESAGAEEVAVTAPPGGDHRHELRAAIDEEVRRLPESLRAPVLLCYFQGHTHDEAAARLGCPVGTVRSRMARARDLLRGRLSRRGVALPAAVFAAVLESETASAAVPEVLFNATVRAALHAAAGRALAAGMVSAGAARLSEGVITSMKLASFQWAAGLALAVGLTGTGVGLARQFGGNAPPSAPRAEDQPIERLRETLKRPRSRPSVPAAARRNWLTASSGWSKKLPAFVASRTGRSRRCPPQRPRERRRSPEDRELSRGATGSFWRTVRSSGTPRPSSLARLG